MGVRQTIRDLRKRPVRQAKLKRVAEESAGNSDAGDSLRHGLNARRGAPDHVVAPIGTITRTS